MNKILKLSVGLIMVMLLASCAKTIKSDVSRFHELSAPSGETVVIVPKNQTLMPSLEFASYAKMVGDYLGQYGYRPANGAKADLIVELDYGVDDGQVHVRSYPSMYNSYYGYPFYGGYFHRWGYYRNAFYPYFGIAGHHAPEVRSYVKYNRHLDIAIRKNEENGKNIFEGKVSSIGRKANLNEVMPYMVQAMFEGFPGVSGSTDRVIVDTETGVASIK